MISNQTNRDGLWTHGGSKFVIGTLHGELIQIEERRATAMARGPTRATSS